MPKIEPGNRQKLVDMVQEAAEYADGVSPHAAWVLSTVLVALVEREEVLFADTLSVAGAMALREYERPVVVVDVPAGFKAESN